MPQTYTELLNKQEKLVNKVKTFIEVNINFTVWQENIFKIQSKAKKLNNLINADANSTVVE